MLLTDGRVLAQASPGVNGVPSAGQFYLLTPDINGSYANGTWRAAARPPTGYAPYAGNQAVLADGRVFFAGGEYNQDHYGFPFCPSCLTNMSAVYDPATDSWTMIPAPLGLDRIADPAGVLLPDGRYLIGEKLSNRMWVFDPASMAWTAVANSGFTEGDFAEMGFTLLPSGAVLTVSVRNAPMAWHFVPSTATWVAEAATPVSLVETTGGSIGYAAAPSQVVGGVSYGPAPAGTYIAPGEIGPSMLRPDGSVWAVGAANSGTVAHTALYHPGASVAVPGTWTVGPDIPNMDNADDTSAAFLPSGNVLLAIASGRLYEFDGAALTQVRAPASNGGGTILLPLPSGEVLVLTPGETILASLYRPLGSPLDAWRPTISTAPGAIVRGQSYAISGTQLNGLSEAAKFGDELENATNYPLVRITNTATGHVTYARTHGHTMGVATGTRLVTTTFDVPTATETGPSRVEIVANGIASAARDVTVS